MRLEFVLLWIWFSSGKNGKSPPWNTWGFMEVTNKNRGREGSRGQLTMGLECCPASGHLVGPLKLVPLVKTSCHLLSVVSDDEYD